jgi:hypothetical protein
MTLNQVITVLQTFAQNHKQINDFGRGFIEEIGASQDQTYPIMWVASLSGRYGSKDYSYSFQILFGDLIFDDKRNELEVQSDMQSVALDLCAFLRDNPDYDFQMDDTATIDYFTERLGDFAAGVLLSFTLRDPFPLDRCVIPI